jgi:hypothetical protein
MTAILKENYNDPLEYARNLKQLGMSEEMATYQARYNKNYVEKTIKDVIADLHLEQFATKQDILRLEKEIMSLKVELLRWQIGIAIVIMSANFALFKLMLHP